MKNFKFFCYFLGKILFCSERSPWTENLAKSLVVLNGKRPPALESVFPLPIFIVLSLMIWMIWWVLQLHQLTGECCLFCYLLYISPWLTNSPESVFILPQGKAIMTVFIVLTHSSDLRSSWPMRGEYLDYRPIRGPGSPLQIWDPLYFPLV